MNKAGIFTLLLLSWVFLPGGSAVGGELEVMVEIPRLNVSEYHRPYVAVWVHDENQKVVGNLAVWYQMRDPQDNVGTKWLPDLRQWWRRSGRGLQLPIDGVTGATRHAGQHKLTFTDKDRQLSQLAPGKYTLMVEAAREVGGRELLEIDFSWPVKDSQSFKTQGKEELGAVTLKLLP